MAKSHAQRQKEYLKRLKEKGEADCLKKKRMETEGKSTETEGKSSSEIK